MILIWIKVCYSTFLLLDENYTGNVLTRRNINWLKLNQLMLRHVKINLTFHNASRHKRYLSLLEGSLISGGRYFWEFTGYKIE